VPEQLASPCTEVKVTYALNPRKEQQQYNVTAFMFYNPELQAAKAADFYRDLYETVRLHVPKVMNRLSHPFP
jgi:hypothetical protein